MLRNSIHSIFSKLKCGTISFFSRRILGSLHGGGRLSPPSLRLPCGRSDQHLCRHPQVRIRSKGIISHPLLRAQVQALPGTNPSINSWWWSNSVALQAFKTLNLCLYVNSQLFELFDTYYSTFLLLLDFLDLSGSHKQLSPLKYNPSHLKKF